MKAEPLNEYGRIAQGSERHSYSDNFFFITISSGRKYGRIAQGSERHSYKVDVAGSNPATPT